MDDWWMDPELVKLRQEHLRSLLAWQDAREDLARMRAAYDAERAYYDLAGRLRDEAAAG